MEDVLAVYHRPPDDRLPVVCVDETSKQLVSETRVPWPAAPGQPVRYDYEYRRQGVCNLFMITVPQQGWRTVQVTARRTKLDFAAVLRDLTDVHFPQAAKVVLVCDNLNTHPGLTVPQTCLLVDALLPRTGSPTNRALAIVDYRRARTAAARRSHAQRRRRYCEYLFQRHQVSLHY